MILKYPVKSAQWRIRDVAEQSAWAYNARTRLLLGVSVSFLNKEQETSLWTKSGLLAFYKDHC